MQKHRVVKGHGLLDAVKIFVALEMRVCRRRGRGCWRCKLELSCDGCKQEMMMAKARVGMESKNRMQETLARPNWLIEWWSEEAGVEGDSWISNLGGWHHSLRYGRRSRSEVGMRVEIVTVRYL